MPAQLFSREPRFFFSILTGDPQDGGTIKACGISRRDNVSQNWNLTDTLIPNWNEGNRDSGVWFQVREVAWARMGCGFQHQQHGGVPIVQFWD